MYFTCARNHYVTSHRGESLAPGSLCPAKDCTSRLQPATTTDDRCSLCKKGAVLPTTVDGLDVLLCSYCGRSNLALAPGEDVTPARPQTGAERVAKHRAASRAAATA